MLEKSCFYFFQILIFPFILIHLQCQVSTKHLYYIWRQHKKYYHTEVSWNKCKANGSVKCIHTHIQIVIYGFKALLLFKRCMLNVIIKYQGCILATATEGQLLLMGIACALKFYVISHISLLWDSCACK